MKVGRFLRDDTGQALALTAVCMTCLFGFLGFVTDAGLLLRAKRIAQAAADSAAISGAAELAYGDVSTAAQSAATHNGVTNGSNGATVTVNNPPLSGPHTNNAAFVEVITTLRAKTIFMQLFNYGNVTVAARAVAGNVALAHGCIYTLDPTATNAFWVTGSGAISLPYCSIYDDSNDPHAMKKEGSSTVTAGSIGIVGGFYETAGSVSPNPVTGIAPVPDPLAYLPAPTVPPNCTATVNITGAATSTTTAVYQGCYASFNYSGSKTVILNSGQYIIDGSGVNVLSITGSGSITGSNVFFYLTGGGSASISGSGAMNLTAPTTGTYNGILFFQDRADNSQININGSTSSTLEGIIYAPAAQLIFNGSSGSTLYTDIITDEFKATGTFTMNDYADINSGTPLRGAALVE